MQEVDDYLQINHLRIQMQEVVNYFQENRLKVVSLMLNVQGLVI